MAQQADGGGDGEAYYVEVVAFDAGDPAGGVALDAVGAGFVERVAGGDVVAEFGVGDFGEGDVGGFDVLRCEVAVTTARPVWTWWVRPESRRSMRSASAGSVGLSRISLA